MIYRIFCRLGMHLWGPVRIEPYGETASSYDHKRDCLVCGAHQCINDCPWAGWNP